MSGHAFALCWGPFAVVFGTCFIIFRRQISRMARAQRNMRGARVGPSTQSPILMAIGGAFFIVVGIVVFVGALMGFLR